jgi:hypothetical protein
MRTAKRCSWLLATLLAIPVLAGAQEDPGHGGGGGGAGCGDVLGDLIHVRRDAVTGQPILARRWIEMPGDMYDWGYCSIAVTAAGEEIGFVDLSCDPIEPEAVVEVDYFGHLSGGRTKERKSRMHFNEVISSIKDADWVTTDETGRLKMGYECTIEALLDPVCAEWSTVDSPMENLGLYTRLMKYGHFQTDPMEEDKWAHGDPATMPQYHPALGPEDQSKFDEKLVHLLAIGGVGGPQVCFPAYPGDSETFNPQCAENENLHFKDLSSASNFLAAAANKTGIITVDLVQYMNRILKITLDTEATVATRNTLPALIRDCPTMEPPVPGVEPVYLDDCEIVEGSAALPAPADERFVNFRAAQYQRRWRDEPLYVLQPDATGAWAEVADLPLLTWLEYVNGTMSARTASIDAFVTSSSDALRAIEFLHNYGVPENLWLIHSAE